MISIISVIEKGDVLAYKLGKILGGKLYLKSQIDDFIIENVVQQIFREGNEIIFISSTGIAVRAIAKSIKSKDIDPAVVVVDIFNNFTISLLSGHLGGANELTLKVAEILGNIPVITTATDNMGIKAPDIIAKDNNLLIDNLKMAKFLASRLVNNSIVYFKDDENRINCPYKYIRSDKVRQYTLWITNSSKNIENSLKLIRQNVVVGVGCRKGIEFSKLKDFLIELLEVNNIDIRSIKAVGSIDVKRDEFAINELGKLLKVKNIFFSRGEISKVQDRYKGSEFVNKNVGVRAVCEPVVELMGGKIIVSKVKREGMTLAIGVIR